MQAFFLAILNMSITSGVVALLLLILRPLLKKLPRRIAYALWGAVLIRLLLPFSFPSPASMFAPLQTYIPAGEGTISRLDYFQTPVPSGNAPDATPGGSAASPKAPVLAKAIDPAGALAAAWLGGSILLAAGAALFQIHTKRILHGATRLHGCVALQNVKKLMGVRRAIPIYQSNKLDSPVVSGIVRPRIVLPLGLPTGDSQELRLILSHELIHIRRHDLLFRGLALAALCLHWFNPLVWAAYLASVRDMEASCDESVLRQCGEDVRQGYAQSLLRMAIRQNAAFPASFLAFGESDVKERVKGIMKYKKGTALGILSSAVLVLCIGCAALSNPQEKAGQPAQTAPAPKTEGSQEERREAAPQEEAPAVVPARIVQVLGDKIHVDAEVTAPPVTSAGEIRMRPLPWDAQQVQAMLLGDRELPEGNREGMTGVSLFLQGKEQGEVFGSSLLVGESDLGYQTERGWYASSFYSAPTPNNTSQNAHRYQKESLDFMPPAQAAQEVSAILDKLGIEVCDPAVAALDFETLGALNREEADMMGEMMGIDPSSASLVSNGGDSFIPLRNWTKEDDCYYIRFRQASGGIALFDGWVMEISDANSLYVCPDIAAILSKDGIESLSVSFAYAPSGEGSAAAAIIPPEQAVEALASDVLLNAPDDQFARADLDRAALCYLPRYGSLGEEDSFLLTPAWIFSGTYDKYFEGEPGPRNVLYMAVNAITGEFITALPLNTELSELL